LDGAQKDTIDHLKVAFSERFIKPPVLRFRSACEMFGKKQADNESVDAYANRLRSLAKRVDIHDATLLYAFVFGLREKLTSFVLGKNPANIESAINDARVAEMSLGETAGSDTGFLSQQVTEMPRDLQKLGQRYDSIAISAPIQRERLKLPFQVSHFRSLQHRLDAAKVTECYKPLEVAVLEELEEEGQVEVIR